MTSVVITQSNYVPWRGWYAMVRAADTLVYLDDVQFTRRDWRNRNVIAGGREPKWMTIPLKNSGNYHSLIHEMTVSDQKWWESHLSLLENTYRNQKFFNILRTELYSVYQTLEGVDSLSSINRRVNEWIFSALEITTAVRDSQEIPSQLKQSERLVEICKFIGADEYVSGPAAKVYLDETIFEANAVKVRWIDYSRLPPIEVPQLPEQELSILHFLASMERSKVIHLSSFNSGHER